MHRLVKSLFFLYLAVLAGTVKAQLCKGTFGKPLINQTFGQGNNTESWYGPLEQYAPGAYTFTTFMGPPGRSPSALSPNQSGLVKTPATPGNPYPIYWQPHADHTGDDNGLMLLIDGIATPTVFFEQKMDNLCPNTILRLSIWVLNANSPAANSQDPNMILRIIDPANRELGNKSTGNVPADRIWHQYFIDFNNGNSSTITLQLINNTATNSGNDFALDDITVQACGPSLSPYFNGNDQSLSMCEDNTQNFTLNANITSSYADPVYQWQENTGNAWTDIAGKTSRQVSIDFLNRTKGTYQYRLITATNGNIDKIYCRTISDPVTLTVNSQLNTSAGNSGPACPGSNVQLMAGDGSSFKWIGPNGYTSDSKNPIINNVQANMSGLYTVTASLNGCTSTASTTLTILSPAVISTNINAISICENSPVQLMATGASSYIWSPSEGLSDPNIANPIAQPKVTTVYRVAANDGSCSTTAQITVNILKPSSTDAGTDQKIITGQSITLNGKVSGGEITYFWTPSDYLDDPTKLNPVATPPQDIIYTLTAVSNLGCTSSSDDVFVKVYPELVIPNTFSPNGDGINDTWNIPAASAFQNPLIKITNRYGQLVYQSTGTFKPWDGKMNGKDLPPAVYYYSIYLNGDFKSYSGWVMLMR